MNSLPSTKSICRSSSIMWRRLLLPIFLLSLVGCRPASPSPKPETVLTETPTPMPSPASPSRTWWQPTIGLTWQWQIGDLDIDTSIAADVYDIDLYVDQSIID